MLKDIYGFNGKYVMNENKEVFNKETGEMVKSKIRGASVSPSYRLYGSNGSVACKTVESWFRITYPELVKIDGYKDIPGFEGKYGISRQGDVYSYALMRTIVAHPSKTSDYLYVELSARGETKHYSVHHGKVVKHFKSIKAATVYGSEHFGASRTGLERNLKSKGCEIKSVTTSPMGRRAESDYRSKCDTPKG